MGKNRFCGLGSNNAYYSLLFRKRSVWFNQHLTQEPSLYLSNGIYLGELLLCAEVRSHKVSRLGVGREDGSFGSPWD